jgi:hypothetical protein
MVWTLSVHTIVNMKTRHLSNINYSGLAVTLGIFSFNHKKIYLNVKLKFTY